MTLNQKTTEEKINDRIDEWHKGTGRLELHEFLGWTEKEYETFVLTKGFPEREKIEYQTSINQEQINGLINQEIDSATLSRTVYLFGGNRTGRNTILKERARQQAAIQQATRTGLEGMLGCNMRVMGIPKIKKEVKHAWNRIARGGSIS